MAGVAGVAAGAVSEVGVVSRFKLSSLRSCGVDGVGVDDVVGVGLIGWICFLRVKRPVESSVPTTKSNTVRITIIETTILKYFLVSAEVGQTTWSNSLMDSCKKDIESTLQNRIRKTYGEII